MKKLNFIEKRSDSKTILIGLHGLGDTKEGFSFLSNELGNFHYFFPDAPLNYHNVGYAWYLMDRNNDSQEKDIQDSAMLIEDLVKEIKQKYPKKDIFLFGFSQGCVMTLQYALRNPEFFKGIIGLSGYIFRPDKFYPVISKNSRDLPVLIVHGRRDDIIKDIYLHGKDIKDYLSRKVEDISYEEFDMAHEINHDVIDTMKRWINDKI